MCVMKVELKVKEHALDPRLALAVLPAAHRVTGRTFFAEAVVTVGRNHRQFIVFWLTIILIPTFASTFSRFGK